MYEPAFLTGTYHAQLFDPDRNLIREWTWKNIVCTQGKNVLFDAAFKGNGYVVTGPYMGLVTASGYSGVNVANTMASHATWTEATSYNGPRKIMLFSPASGGQITQSSPCFFEFTTTDTIRGAFVSYGSGATSTVGGTTGSLYSVGAFSVDQAVVNGASLNVTYTAAG